MDASGGDGGVAGARAGAGGFGTSMTEYDRRVRQRTGAGDSPAATAFLQRQFDKYVDNLLAFKRDVCSELVAVDDLSAVKTLCALFDALATHDNGCTPDANDLYLRTMELWFLFAVVWSIGASVTKESRRLFDMRLREIDGQFPAKDTVFEHFVDWKVGWPGGKGGCA